VQREWRPELVTEIEKGGKTLLTERPIGHTAVWGIPREKSTEGEAGRNLKNKKIKTAKG